MTDSISLRAQRTLAALVARAVCDLSREVREGRSGDDDRATVEDLLEITRALGFDAAKIARLL